MRTILIAIFGLFLSAQTATVVPLSDKDAGKAKQLYQELQDAQKRWDEFREKIADVYLPHGSEVGVLDTKGKVHYALTDGWENGFEFSSDFRFVVPKPQPVHTNPNWLWPQNKATMPLVEQSTVLPKCPTIASGLCLEAR